MESYNKHDVVILEKLYYRLLPWIKAHANYSAHSGERVCPNCGSLKSQKRGVTITQAGRYPRYQCQDCGSWYRGSKMMFKKGGRMVSI
jgi:transposase-like protein